MRLIDLLKVPNSTKEAFVTSVTSSVTLLLCYKRSNKANGILTESCASYFHRLRKTT